MEKRGEIFGLRLQYEMVLIPAQRDESGKLIERAVTYIADFAYLDRDGELVVEDAKGVRTPAYIIKRKLCLYMHGIRIREV